MKYANKPQFMTSVDESWQVLVELCASLPEASMNRRQRELAPRDFALAWAPKDVCAHIHAWHKLFLNWYASGPDGSPELPAPGFNWRQTPQLNRELFEQFRDLPASSIVRRMKLSHNRIMKLAAGLRSPVLMKPGHFAWTGKLGLISYLSANTDSHYRWGTRKIRKLTGQSRNSGR